VRDLSDLTYPTTVVILPRLEGLLLWLPVGSPYLLSLFTRLVLPPLLLLFYPQVTLSLLGMLPQTLGVWHLATLLSELTYCTGSYLS
jgi:hypothetical protein